MTSVLEFVIKKLHVREKMTWNIAPRGCWGCPFLDSESEHTKKCTMLKRNIGSYPVGVCYDADWGYAMQDELNKLVRATS